MSDHFSIVLDAGDYSWGLNPLRFFNSWLKDKECVRLMESKLPEDISYGCAGFVISPKLCNLKLVHKQWNTRGENSERK